MSVLMMCRN